MNWDDEGKVEGGERIVERGQWRVESGPLIAPKICTNGLTSDSELFEETLK